MNQIEELEELVQKETDNKSKWFNARILKATTKYEETLLERIYGKLQSLDWTLKQIRKIKKKEGQQKIIIPEAQTKWASYILKEGKK
ncbi:MAG TPA: hypothetical protein ENH95_02845 [Nitrosopumilus sp.]|nr:hypothetical protein [Nitrosopumilus sp.]